MEDKGDIFQQIGSFLSSNALYTGLFFSIVGFLILLACIFDSSWLFGGARTYNVSKIEGMVNTYGRKTTRVIIGLDGILLVVLGIVWSYFLS